VPEYSASAYQGPVANVPFQVIFTHSIVGVNNDNSIVIEIDRLICLSA